MNPIRLATTDDAVALAGIYRPAVEGSAISFEVVAPDAREMARRIERTMMRTPWLVWDEEGVLGYAYATMHRERAAYQWSVDVSAYVRSDQHRRGIGRALYTSLLAVLVLQGFRNAYAGITLPNPASVGLHTDLGFTPVGTYRQVGYKLGAWHDVLWLGRELAPRIHEPPTPVPLSELSRSPALPEALGCGVDSMRARTTRGDRIAARQPFDGGSP